MKRYVCLIALTVLTCFVLTGCGFWMNGDYLSVTPHKKQILASNETIIAVSSYAQMESTLVELVESGVESTIISASNFDMEALDSHVNTVIDNIMHKSCIASYAVKKITYEIGTNRGLPVIAFKVNYLHGHSEILRIRHCTSMDVAKEQIGNTLDMCNPSVVLRVDRYTDTDFTQLVQDYAQNNPDTVMEVPKVTANIYPENGEDRIIELIFTYQNSREKLREMQRTVNSVFMSAELYVKETVQVSEIYSRLYSFILERNQYKIETSITPTYSLLHHGVGDSSAFANVYAAMCRRAGLECHVVTGAYNGSPWCWNVVRYRREYYHVDLLRSDKMGEFKMFTAREMDGYVWDYEIFPSE